MHCRQYLLSSLQSPSCFFGLAIGHTADKELEARLGPADLPVFTALLEPRTELQEAGLIDPDVFITVELVHGHHALC
jgi:hypothetical protein